MNPPQSSENPAKGALVSQLSREIVQLHARLDGRGPTKSRSYLHSDYAFAYSKKSSPPPSGRWPRG